MAPIPDKRFCLVDAVSTSAEEPQVYSTKEVETMQRIDKKKTIKSVSMATVIAVTLLAGEQVYASDETDELELGEKLLYQGVVHEHVIELQEKLAENQLLEEVDDEQINELTYYSEEIAEAVKQFQKEHELVVDGIAGIQTLSALSGLEKGDEGFLIEELQTDLKELGYYPFSVDGIFGSKTEEALIQFQSDYQAEDSEGVAGPDTLRLLHEQTRYSTGKEGVENTNTVADSGAESSEKKTADSADEVMTMEATAYTAYCDGCSGITATGIDLRSQPDMKVVAVDPEVIPLGAVVEVEGYGRAVAADTGGAITGSRIDLHMPTKEDAVHFGRRQVNVRIIEAP